ncbi:hypothetical protein H8B02_12140 [Bradyrhizobium sp. Pear77]|uniref:hypothetical protein n=1 Tax=Bradyrhizobium altum TaxID=1571202 RepID=UPI001E642DB1|nr:hypothetical protein [Bradyrhizobium altum]MCC8954175.1 hypothetical protein [Bradyrhizobium altum]
MLITTPIGGPQANTQACGPHERFTFREHEGRRCRYAALHSVDGLMPLFRYFLFTSAMLLGLLLFADWYLPAAPVTIARNDIDHVTIRIHSQHKWPEAIQMDTNAPIVTASPADPTPITTLSPMLEAQAAAVAQADAPRLTPSKPPEQAARRVKPARHAQRDSRRRLAQRSQRFASYRAPDWQGWQLPSW